MFNDLQITETAQLRFADFRKDAEMDRLALSASAGRKSGFSGWANNLFRLFRVRRSDRMWKPGEGQLAG